VVDFQARSAASRRYLYSGWSLICGSIENSFKMIQLKMKRSYSNSHSDGNGNISNVTTKSHARAKCFISLYRLSIVKAFKVHVRPVGYNASMRSASHVNLIEHFCLFVHCLASLESVQRRFTKRIFGIYFISVDIHFSRCIQR